MNLTKILDRNFTSITDEYRSFAEEKSKCRRCSTYDVYEQVGQSEGNAKNPTFMIVGGALGQDEVEAVRPFVGRAGQRIRQELRKHRETFNRESTLISNVLSCRPYNNQFPKPSNGEGFVVYPDNRETSKDGETPDVADYCASHWLRREINLVKPKVIITLGAVSLKYVSLSQEELRGQISIKDYRGEWRFLPQHRAWTMSTYHPSYVLRCTNDGRRSYVVDLFEQDMAKIARTWRIIVDSDSRMSLSEDEWKRRVALDSFRGKLTSAGVMLGK